ncbi:MAG: LPS export ABC transporter periplasmic protein LptC [Treponema sp.]|nr:LPS export ABC transporter periplasmic protein LptC [Treponema sp.]
MTLIKSNKIYILSIILPAILLFSCTFDYGTGDSGEELRPDIVMENIEYVRIRGGDPLARFRAEYAERRERNQTMDLRDFSFEQMEDRGETVNVEGTAGAARVYLSSGDILLSGGVIVNIESEDISISTDELEWRDDQRLLLGAPDAEVEVLRSDGTNFIGRGLSANIRNRTWAFTGEVTGTFIEEDEEE